MERAERALFTRVNRELAARGAGQVSKRRGSGHVLVHRGTELPINLRAFARRLGVERPYQLRKLAAEERRERLRRRREVARGETVEGEDTAAELVDDWLWRKIVRGQIEPEGRKLVEELVEDLKFYEANGAW